MQTDTGSIIIIDVGNDDFGKYECTVSNHIDGHNYSLVVRVYLYNKRKFFNSKQIEPT